MTIHERRLSTLLRVQGAVLLLALPAVVMPTSWMGEVHERLGLGELPRGAIVEYLTRSLSLVYGLCGPVYVVLARDVRKYRDVIGLALVSQSLLALGLLPVNVSAGMPTWWALGESGAILALSAAMTREWLAARR